MAMRDYATLVKALNEISDKTSCYYCHGESLDCKTAGCYISDAADAIEELQSEVVTIRHQLPHWISVEERLPEFRVNDSGCVCTGNIVFRTEYKTVHLGYAIRTTHNIETVDGFEQILMDRWYDQTGDMIDGVTHWMPLPEPPTEVE